MTQRKTGVVVNRDMADAPVDFISIGLKAFGHRQAISQLIAEVRPIIDVAVIQIPRILALGKELAAELMPEWQTSLAVSTGGIVCMFNVEWVQKSLTTLGYNPGKVDGIHGKQSRAAVRQFQIDNNLLPDEWPGQQTCIAIGWKLKEQR
jgi:hypothetical protein